MKDLVKTQLNETIKTIEAERQSYAMKIYDIESRLNRLEMKNYIYYIGANSALQKNILWDQVDDVIKYQADIFVMGDDWKGKFDFLKDDVYVYDKHKMVAEGKRTHNVLKIGSPFEVKVYKASKSNSMIDFVPSNYKITKSESKKDSYRKKGKRHG